MSLKKQMDFSEEEASRFRFYGFFFLLKNSNFELTWLNDVDKNTLNVELFFKLLFSKIYF